MKIEGKRTYDNLIYRKVTSTHRSMMNRCYNSNCTAYKNYGELGVTVADEWHNLNDFIETIDSVEGFDLELWLDNQLQLDKDIKQSEIPLSERVYSVETCLFISPSDNSGNRRNNKEMIIISPEGKRYYTRNREKFCREHNLNSRRAFNCLTKKNKHCKGWQFFYKDEFKESLILPVRIIEAISPNGERYEFNSISVFAKEHGLSEPNISMVLSGRQRIHKGWVFNEIQSGITSTFIINAQRLAKE